VTERVVECESDPEAAVMVTVALTGGLGDDPPPHPLRRTSPAALTASSNTIVICRRLFHPRQQITSAKAVLGRSGLGLWRSAAVVAEVVTVTVLEATPVGVTVAGEKLHEAPTGNPDEQLKLIAEANPPCAANETVAVPLAPPATVIDDGATATVKSGGRLIMYAALATALIV
jgi:hypothetical protein